MPDYGLASFVSRGKTRKMVLENLGRPKTPTQLSNLLQTHRSTVSRSISQLRKKGLVVCLTPKEKTGRLYKISRKGEGVLGLL